MKTKTKPTLTLTETQPKKTVSHLFRLSEEKTKIFEQKLVESGMKKQHFLEQIVEAYIAGKIA